MCCDLFKSCGVFIHLFTGVKLRDADAVNALDPADLGPRLEHVQMLPESSETRADRIFYRSGAANLDGFGF